MPTTTNERPYKREDFSGGTQRKTIKFMQRPSEVDLGVNAAFDTRIGGVEKIAGMSRIGNTVTSTSTSTSTTTSSSTSTSSTTTA